LESRDSQRHKRKPFEQRKRSGGARIELNSPSIHFSDMELSRLARLENLAPNTNSTNRHQSTDSGPTRLGFQSKACSSVIASLNASIHAKPLLHSLFGLPLADSSPAFEIGQPALHFFTYVEMVLNIFECGVIGKILNKRKSLPLCCFHHSLLDSILLRSLPGLSHLQLICLAIGWRALRSTHMSSARRRANKSSGLHWRGVRLCSIPLACKNQTGKRDLSDFHIDPSRLRLFRLG
jgi:hypothetical protein